MIELAIAFVLLTPEPVDRIDELVTPGTTINAADSGYANPALQPAAGDGKGWPHEAESHD